MQFFMIEWFHAGSCCFHQEYFMTMEEASKRFIMLRDDVQGSHPAIETLHMEDA